METFGNPSRRMDRFRLGTLKPTSFNALTFWRLMSSPVITDSDSGISNTDSSRLRAVTRTSSITLSLAWASALDWAAANGMECASNNAPNVALRTVCGFTDNGIV